MYTYELLAVALYIVLLILIGCFAYRKHLSASDFIIGGRSLNVWLTALAAHASDMSSWLFIGYPAVIFTTGMYHSWTAIGLLVFMYLNWQLVAPKIRVMTERSSSLTFSSFFESRLNDTSGTLRVVTAIICFFFYTVYISAGLVGLGLLLETLFGVTYETGIWIGILFVIPYVFIGGYLMLAWVDLFQGFFLLAVIVFVPLNLIMRLGGFSEVNNAISLSHLSTSLLPHFSLKTIWEAFLLFAGFGLGYFGQPHIVTKFMGIRHVNQINRSKYIGMSWMFLSLAAATLCGLVGIAFFQGQTQDPQLVFIDMVKLSYHPFLLGLILCAVVAATMNAMSSQVLVLTSTLTEDIYKRLFRKEASSKERLLVSRTGTIFVGIIAFFIAYQKPDSIFNLVQYAWSGLGASFGPLLLLCLYWKKVTKYGAWAGIISGALIAALWPCIKSFCIPSLIPSFIISFIFIVIVSLTTQGNKGVIELKR